MHQVREDILYAYQHFSPASIAVVTRLEHMVQIPDISRVCRQLHEEGLLSRELTDDGIVQYALSEHGQSLLKARTKVAVGATKQNILRQLRAREKQHAKARRKVLNILRESPYYLTALQLHAQLPKLEFPQLSSVLFGLLQEETIRACGPLYVLVR